MNSCQWLRQMLLGHVLNLDVSVLVGDMHMCCCFVCIIYLLCYCFRCTSCVQEAVKKNRAEKNPWKHIFIIHTYITHNLAPTWTCFNTQMYSKQKIRQTNSSSTRYTRMLPQLTFIRPNPITPLGVHSRKVVGQFLVFPRRLVVNLWLEQSKSSFNRGLDDRGVGWILWNHFLDEFERGSLGRERSYFPCYRHELNR